MTQEPFARLPLGVRFTLAPPNVFSLRSTVGQMTVNHRIVVRFHEGEPNMEPSSSGVGFRFLKPGSWDYNPMALPKISARNRASLRTM